MVPGLCDCHCHRALRPVSSGPHPRCDPRSGSDAPAGATAGDRMPNLAKMCPGRDLTVFTLTYSSAAAWRSSGPVTTRRATVCSARVRPRKAYAVSGFTGAAAASSRSQACRQGGASKVIRRCRHKLSRVHGRWHPAPGDVSVPCLLGLCQQPPPAVLAGRPYR